MPTENAVPIGSIDAADAGKWCALATLLVPFGGLLAADLKAGETLLVSIGTVGTPSHNAVLRAGIFDA